jgi:hypothetical protein
VVVAAGTCALDRLTLLSAGSEPKVGALFAEVELHRSFCGQRDPILAETPKYKLLWKALANRPLPRRIRRYLNAFGPNDTQTPFHCFSGFILDNCPCLGLLPGTKAG